MPTLTDSYRLTRTVAPAIEPVTTCEALTHLRLPPCVDVITGATTASGHFNVTTNPLTVTGAVTAYPDISWTVGRLIKIDDEILEVSSVSGSDVTLLRGQKDTLVAAHANNEAIYQGTAEEENVFRLVQAAREEAEEYTLSAFNTQTWTLRLDELPLWLKLPRPPLVSVSSIVYADAEGDATTLAADQYTVSVADRPGLIVPAYNVSWPTVRGHLGDVTVTFVAGYGSTRASVPQRIRQAVLLMTEAAYYGDCDKGGKGMAARRLLDFHSFRTGF